MFRVRVSGEDVQEERSVDNTVEVRGKLGKGRQIRKFCSSRE